MNVKNALLWGAAGLVAVSAGASFAANGGAAKISAMVRPAHVSDVTRTVANVDNGVVITMSASGADAIAQLQKRELAMPLRSVEKTDTGVRVTLTSADADTVKALQSSEGRVGGGMMGGERGGKMGRGDKGPRGGFGSGAMMDFSSLKRVVTNVDNGVTVTMTSDKAEVAKLLQDGHAGRANGMKSDDAVTVTKENVDGGVKLTITSTDAATVKLIQEREASGPQMGMGGKGRGMMGGRGMGRGADSDADAQ